MRDREGQSDFRAFTLIELLVTVAIISILAGLLLPSLSRAKGKAQGVKCVSNGRQLGIGLMLYVGDHEEKRNSWGLARDR